MRADEDLEIPPLVSCALCNLPDCAGHSAEQDKNAAERLPWESALAEQMPLFATAEAVTSKPAVVLAPLGKGPLSSAFSFAVSVELLTVTSIAALGFAVVSLLFPSWAASSLWTARGLTTTLASTAGFAGLLILLHVVWAIAMELYLGLFFKHWQFRRSLRFSLYACGWDFWASPAGVTLGLIKLGAGPTFSLCQAAAQVAPRQALRSYLSEGRALPPKLHRRAMLTALAVSGPFILASVMLWLGATIWGLLSFPLR